MGDGQGLGIGGLGVAFALAMVGCSGDSPANDLGPPDVSKITVFFPVDGLVRGQGLAGALPAGIPYVFVAAHPSGGVTIPAANEDGSFSFRVIGVSGDTLELAASRDDLGNDRGETIFIRIPDTPKPDSQFVCCKPTPDAAMGTCQRLADAELGRECPDPNTGVPTRCTDNNDCAVLADQRLSLDPSQIQITSPNDSGLIDVAGTVTNNALVVLQNRGQGAIGGQDPRVRITQISDDVGRFRFTNLSARGDDELVLEIRDLNGFRSPEASFLVPDAQLAGVDITGAFAAEPLTDGETGKVAIRVSPFGVDQRGICPNSNEDPVLCLSGGLTHGMVTISEAKVDQQDVNPVPAEATTLFPLNRGTEGNPADGPQDIVLLIDMSMAAGTNDPDRLRLDAARDMVRSMRSRDSMAMLSFGGFPARQVSLVQDRAPLLAKLDELQSVPTSGDANVFEAVTAATAEITGFPKAAQIVIITTTDPVGGAGAFDVAYDSVRALPSIGFEGYPVTVLGIVPPAGALETDGFLRSLTDFSRGFFLTTPLNSAEIDQTVTDLMGRMSGSFVLLYDMLVPSGVGKRGTLSLTVDVRIGEQTARASYEGPLRVERSRN